jgi:hypothetical protein
MYACPRVALEKLGAYSVQNVFAYRQLCRRVIILLFVFQFRGSHTAGFANFGDDLRIKEFSWM